MSFIDELKNRTPWELHPSCHERQSDMQDIGKVALLFAGACGAAAVGGSLVAALCFSEITLTIVIATVGGTGTIVLVPFSIYVLKKDYWQDPAFRKGKRIECIDFLVQRGYQYLKAHHGKNVLKHQLLTAEEISSCVLKESPKTCLEFIRKHGFQLYDDEVIDVNDTFANGYSLRELFLNEIENQNFHEIFQNYETIFWELLKRGFARNEDVRDKLLDEFAGHGFGEIISRYDWEIFAKKLVSNADSFVQARFITFLEKQRSIISFFEHLYDPCKSYGLIPGFCSVEIEALKAQYEEAQEEHSSNHNAISVNIDKQIESQRAMRDSVIFQYEQRRLLQTNHYQGRTPLHGHRMNHLESPSSNFTTMLLVDDAIFRTRSDCDRVCSEFERDRKRQYDEIEKSYQRKLASIEDRWEKFKEGHIF